MSTIKKAIKLYSILMVYIISYKIGRYRYELGYELNNFYINDEEMEF